MDKRLNILIVDDSLIMRTNLVRSVESIGHKVVAQAKDGQESIKFYEEFKPDLVTMDITMPDMDGITALRKIKEIDPDAKAIMVTSHGQEAMVMNALKAGARGYVLKPISAEKLKDAIGKVFPELCDEESDELLDEEW
ncbi:MAG: response regulator [Campylobacterales bacterium]|nr:response regulator [Campylobacterales bacterium]